MKFRIDMTLEVEADTMQAALMLALAQHPGEVTNLTVYPWFEDTDPMAVPEPTPSVSPPAPADPPTTQTGDAPAEPRAMAKAKALAEENGIDWRTLHPGRGKNGMITQDDVRAAIKAKTQRERAEDPPAPAEGKVEFAQVRQALSGLVQEKGRDAAREFLARYGVDRVSALAENQYAEVVAELAGGA